MIDCVVIDEFHKVSSGVRGWFEEALAIWINYKREQYNYKIVLISAIADDVEDYLNMNITDVFTDIWAPTRKMYCKFVRDPRAPRTNNIKCREEINQGYNLILNYPESDDKYTIKNVFFQTTRGRRTVDGKDPNNSDTKADIAWKALSCVSERPLMVFFYWKAELERFVEKSALYMPVSQKGQMISNKLAQILGESHLLVRVLKRGVAYHNGDLPDDVRGIIESEFRKPNSSIKVLACTTTLADGVNLPAKAILMANVFTRTGNASFRSLDIGDYKNIVVKIYYQTNSEEDIIHWLINVDDKLLYEQLVEVYDVSILEQIGKVRRDNKSKSSYFEKADRIKVSLLTNETENVQNLIADIQNYYLSLNHVKDNPFNEFRVEVVCGGKPIGYLPDIISEEVSEIVDSDEKLKCEFAESETDKIWMYISRVKVEV